MMEKRLRYTFELKIQCIGARASFTPCRILWANKFTSSIVCLSQPLEATNTSLVIIHTSSGSYSGIEVTHDHIAFIWWYGIQCLLQVIQELILVSSTHWESWCIAGEDVNEVWVGPSWLQCDCHKSWTPGLPLLLSMPSSLTTAL